jgi:hypothetical protein
LTLFQPFAPNAVARPIEIENLDMRFTASNKKIAYYWGAAFKWVAINPMSPS